MILVVYLLMEIKLLLSWRWCYLIKSKEHHKKANYLINQATDKQFNYIHNNIGYNFRMSNINAAIGLAQLEKINFYIKKKTN